MVRDGDYLAVFNSAHRVMKAESVLKARGVPILLIPAPRQLLTDCGLALRIGPEVKDKVMQILTDEQLLPEVINRYSNGTYKNVRVEEGDSLK